MATIRARRKELGRVFLDIGKYLFTTIAIGSLISDVNLVTVIIAFLASAFVLNSASLCSAIGILE